MRIGLDVSMLGRGGGIPRSAECLLAALARSATGHSLVLWCGPPSDCTLVRSLAPPGSSIVVPGPVARQLARWGRLAWGNPLSVEAFAGPVDVFHGPNYLLPAQRGKAALMITVHDLSALHHPEWHPPRRALVHRAALRRTIRAVDHVITDTQAIRREVVADLGVPPEKVTAVHPAPSQGLGPRPAPELKPILDRWGLSPGEYLLFAGAIEPRKNLVRVIEAVTTLQTRRRGTPPLILVGPPGWRNREIFEAVAAAAPRVRYLGYVSHEEVAALMAACTAFVMPSLYEGFGLPVLEAMASGVPVVTSRGGALEEVAGDAALLVDPLDPGAIAAGIDHVLDDTVRRETLVRKGLARAAQFTWERTARETLRVYERAIASRR